MTLPTFLYGMRLEGRIESASSSSLTLSCVSVGSLKGQASGTSCAASFDAPAFETF